MLLKSQAGQAPAGSPAAAAGRPPSQGGPGVACGELQEVHATGIKRFTLVNSIAATVSALEAQRLAADPAVAR